MSVLLSFPSTSICRLDRAEIAVKRTGPAPRMVFPYPEGHRIRAANNTKGVKRMIKGKRRSHTRNKGRISLTFFLFPSMI